MDPPTMDTTVGVEAPNAQVTVVKEIKDEPIVGMYVGQCKWFNDRYGYGFITVTQGEQKGKDIFVHHSGIKPLNSIYRTLRKGEYINFNIINGEHGPQAVDVTGIGGGCLMCDVQPSPRVTPVTQVPPPNRPYVALGRGRGIVRGQRSPNRIDRVN